MPIVGARDIAVFSWGQFNEKILFAIASTQTSILAEGVISGFSYQDYENGYEINPYENTPISLVINSSNNE